MRKAELRILEQAFEREIDAALTRGKLHLLQTRSKLAEKLADEGYLSRAKVTIMGYPPVIVSGFELTHLGRMTYCATCEDVAS